MSKILLFGGSFDPIHQGHVQVLSQVVALYQFDEGWFVLANQAPLKNRQLLPFEIRKQYIEWMIEDESQLWFCDIEKNLPTPNYTIKTIEKLLELYPQHDFSLLIGSDQAAGFHLWKEADRLESLVPIYVYQRRNYNYEVNYFIPVTLDYLDVSSTLIRKGLSFKTHPKILRHMMQYGHYADQRLTTYLDKKRCEHSTRVAQLATEIATWHNLDAQLAYSLGMAHDLLKQESPVTLKRFVTEQMQSQPLWLWHGEAMANFCKQKFYVTDDNFTDAILHHVMGEDDKPYSMVLFIADKCEPGRKYDASDLLLKTRHDLKTGFTACKQEADEYNRGKNGHYAQTKLLKI